MAIEGLQTKGDLRRWLEHQLEDPTILRRVATGSGGSPTIWRPSAANYVDWTPEPGWPDPIFARLGDYVDIWMPQMQNDGTHLSPTGYQGLLVIQQVPDTFVPYFIGTNSTSIYFSYTGHPLELFPCEYYIAAYGSTPGFTGELWIDFTPRAGDPAPAEAPHIRSSSLRYPLSQF